MNEKIPPIIDKKGNSFLNVNKKSVDGIKNNQIEINFNETEEETKMRKFYVKMSILIDELPKDKQKEYKKRANDIIGEKIIAEDSEDFKKEIRDKIIRLEEIEREIKEEFEEKNVNSETKALPDSFENNPIAIKSEQKALPGSFENNPIAIKEDKTELPVIVEQKKSTEQIIDNDIRTMLNTAKIRIENADNPEEMEKN